MTLWDKRARGFFLLLVAFYPWAWFLLPPVCLKYYPILFLVTALYGGRRFQQKLKADNEAYERRQQAAYERRRRKYP